MVEHRLLRTLEGPAILRAGFYAPVLVSADIYEDKCRVCNVVSDKNTPEQGQLHLGL